MNDLTCTKCQSFGTIVELGKCCLVAALKNSTDQRAFTPDDAAATNRGNYQGVRNHGKERTQGA